MKDDPVITDPNGVRWRGLNPMLTMVTAEPLPVKPVKLLGRNARTLQLEPFHNNGQVRRPHPNPGGHSD